MIDESRIAREERIREGVRREMHLQREQEYARAELKGKAFVALVILGVFFVCFLISLL